MLNSKQLEEGNTMSQSKGESKHEASSEEPQIRPVVSYLKLPEGGDPYLEGLKCKSCNTVFTNSRKHCPKC